MHKVCFGPRDYTFTWFFAPKILNSLFFDHPIKYEPGKFKPIKYVFEIQNMEITYQEYWSRKQYLNILIE